MFYAQQQATKVSTGVAGEQVAEKSLDWVASTRRQLGEYIEVVHESDWMKQVGRVLGASWLLNLIDQVDIWKVRETVSKIRQQHPDESPNQIAQRLIQRKSLLVGGIGLASGILPPGVNIPVIAVDVIATVVLQLELVYEIAFAYGMNLEDSDRRGEALLVLAAGTGSDRVVNLGVRTLQRVATEKLSGALIQRLAGLVGRRLAEQLFKRSIPIFGAVLGAGTNIGLLALIGNAACKFYEREITVNASAVTELPRALSAQ